MWSGESRFHLLIRKSTSKALNLGAGVVFLFVFLFLRRGADAFALLGRVLDGELVVFELLFSVSLSFFDTRSAGAMTLFRSRRSRISASIQELEDHTIESRNRPKCGTLTRIPTTSVRVTKETW
jgi:hypothetical protein